MSVATVEELSAELHRLGARYASEGSRLGYFASLYGLMTGRVAAGMVSGRFQDPERMQRLACHFASRYLAAVEAHDAGAAPPASWAVAFEAATRWKPIILQHLLLGMNAHINFDLGIAAAEVADGGDLTAVRHDFDEINVLLSELLEDVQTRIERVSPWMRLLDVVGGRKDEAIVNFSLRKARSAAWDVATSLSALDASARPEAERALDGRIAHFARVIDQPGFLITAAALPARLRERASPADVIEVLSRPD
jgi:hypothetical protein